MIKSVPFIPFPFKTARKMARSFFLVADKLEKVSPELEMTLKQAEFDVSTREYIAVALFCSFFWFCFLFSTFAVLGRILELGKFIYIGLLASTVISASSFFYILMYPKLVISRRIREIEKNLLFGLRHLSIQVKAGVPLFDALVSVSKEDYGLLSDELKQCVKRISTGWSTAEAMEELAVKNPSLYFRRAIWQLVNSMRTGADLGNTLESIVNSISSEQRVAIRNYGSQLNPMAMMYMMLGVIIPTLGVTFLTILSSFTGFRITEMVFVGIFAVLFLFQFSFIGMIKSRRPSIEI